MLKLLNISTSRVRMRAAVRRVKNPPPDVLFDVLSPFPSHLTLEELVAVLRYVDKDGGWDDIHVGGDYQQLVGGLALRPAVVGGGAKGVGADRLERIEEARRVRFAGDGERTRPGFESDSSECVRVCGRGGGQEASLPIE